MLVKEEDNEDRLSIGAEQAFVRAEIAYSLGYV